MDIPTQIQEGARGLIERVERDGSYADPLCTVTIINPCRRFIRRLPNGMFQTSDDQIEWVDLPGERLMEIV